MTENETETFPLEYEHTFVSRQMVEDSILSLGQLVGKLVDDFAGKHQGIIIPETLTVKINNSPYPALGPKPDYVVTVRGALARPSDTPE